MKAADKCRLIIRESIDTEISHLDGDVARALQHAAIHAKLKHTSMDIEQYIVGKSKEYRLLFDKRMEDEGFEVSHTTWGSSISWE